MKTHPFRALIVDDEVIARKMLAHSLGREGFECELAKDGQHASTMFEHHAYDLVITDLCMPNKHGHSLAVDLLASPRRPVLIIHTSVDNPQITKDLFARGVDDIMYKPMNYETLAARARILVERRTQLATRNDILAKSAIASPEAGDEQHHGTDQPQLATPPKPAGEKSPEPNVANLPPISDTAMRIYRLTTDNEVEPRQIAATIAVDAALTAQLLIIGNSVKYNPLGEKCTDLERIVVRVGRRRIGELVLACSVRVAAGRESIPWIDADLAWRRSVAAGLAVEMLAEQTTAFDAGSDLFLCATLLPLGRVVLASVSPKQHAEVAMQAEMNGEALDLAERKAFGYSHARFLSNLLEKRNVPVEVTEPLSHAMEVYQNLHRLPELMREQVELLKLANLVSYIAVGAWQLWDAVELPPLAVLRKLGVHSFGSVIEETRHGLASIVAAQSGKNGNFASAKPKNHLSVGYQSLAPGGFDFLAAMLPGMRIQATSDNLDRQKHLFVNCFEIDSSSVAKLFATTLPSHLIFLTDQEQQTTLQELGTVISLPTSYFQLLQACRDVNSPVGK